jgi:serine O-acetyltransferase
MAGEIESSLMSAQEKSTTGIAVADWTREKPERFWDPSRKLLLTIRRYQKFQQKRGGLARLACKFIVLRYRFWSVVCGADIPLNCQLGGGLMMPHPNGIVIHPQSVIGTNCLIFQQVTIGTREIPGAPTIGDRVDIGAGAKILGPVRVGDGVKIGANSVILKDVAHGTTAVGIYR